MPGKGRLRRGGVPNSQHLWCPPCKWKIFGNVHPRVSAPRPRAHQLHGLSQQLLCLNKSRFALLRGGESILGVGGESQAPGAHPQAAPGLQGNEKINKLTGLGSEKGKNPPRRAQKALLRGPVSKTFLINSVFHPSIAAEFPCLKQIPVDYREHIYPALSTSGHRRGLLLCTLVPEHSVICFTPSADAEGAEHPQKGLQRWL